MGKHVKITKLLPIPKDKDQAYIILGIPYGTVGKAIKEAYRALALMYHSDKHEDCDDNCRKLAEESIKAINVAYEKLEDEVKKTECSEARPDDRQKSRGSGTLSKTEISHLRDLEHRLFEAFKDKNLKKAKELIKKVDNLDIQLNQKHLLYYFVQNAIQDVNWFKFFKEVLSEQRIDPKVVVDEYGKTALHIAARAGHLEMAELLLDHGVDVDAKNKDGETPLHFAAEMGDLRFVKFLLSKKANVNAAKRYGHTPIFLAAIRGYIEVIKELYANGGDPNAQDNDGWTMLRYVVQNGWDESDYDNLKIIKVLLSCEKIDPRIPDKDGQTPLDIAIRNGYLEASKLLMNHTYGVALQEGKNKVLLPIAPKEDTVCSQDDENNNGEATTLSITEEIDSRPRVVPHIPIIVSRGNHDEIQNEKQPQRKAQAKPNANKVRNIDDILQISKAHYTFESYESGEGVAELSAEEICKMNQYAKDIRKDSEELDKFIKKIDEVRTRLLIALDDLHPDVLPKYISEGKIEVLKKYVRVVKQYFKITADILYERGKLDDKDKFVCEDSVAKKLKRIEDAENEAQKESGQPQQKAQSADNAPEKGTPTLSPQITPQNKSNVYDNKGFGIEKIMGVVGAIAGAIIGATIAYLAGATLPIIAAIAVISAVPGVLIGYGIAEICEKASRKRQNDPKKGMLTALSIVLTPKCLSDNDVVNPSLGASRGA